MTGENWRWPETSWRSGEIDWRRGGIVTAGVDVGSVSSQAVVLVDGSLYAYGSLRTGSSSPESASRAMGSALEGTGLEIGAIRCIVGTGYGRVRIPFAHRAVTEIACHGRAAVHMYGTSVRTVLDMGGQDLKVMHVDPAGRVTRFLMNDKCAAGTGRGLEVFADLLGVPVEEVGALSLAVDEEPEPVSSTCVVFAKSEAASLLRSGWPRERVLAAYCSAMVRRVVSLLRRLGVERELAITGGIAKNVGITTRLERELDLSLPAPRVDAQIAGALGAALFAHVIARKE
jgi:bzd-type benzoyl-CoA reductase Q subunit